MEREHFARVKVAKIHRQSIEAARVRAGKSVPAQTRRGCAGVGCEIDAGYVAAGSIRVEYQAWQKAGGKVEGDRIDPPPAGRTIVNAEGIGVGGA